MWFHEILTVFWCLKCANQDGLSGEKGCHSSFDIAWKWLLTCLLERRSLHLEWWGSRRVAKRTCSCCSIWGWVVQSIMLSGHSSFCVTFGWARFICRPFFTFSLFYFLLATQLFSFGGHNPSGENESGSGWGVWNRGSMKTQWDRNWGKKKKQKKKKCDWGLFLKFEYVCTQAWIHL